MPHKRNNYQLEQEEEEKKKKNHALNFKTKSKLWENLLQHSMKDIEHAIFSIQIKYLRSREEKWISHSHTTWWGQKGTMYYAELLLILLALKRGCNRKCMFGFLGWSSGWDFALPRQRLQIRSLVKRAKTHTSHNVTKKKKKIHDYKIIIIFIKINNISFSETFVASKWRKISWESKLLEKKNTEISLKTTFQVKFNMTLGSLY